MSIFSTQIASLDLSKRIIDILSSYDIVNVSSLLNFLDKNKLQDIDGISNEDEDVILNVLRDLFDSIFVDIDGDGDVDFSDIMSSLLSGGTTLEEFNTFVNASDSINGGNESTNGDGDDLTDDVDESTDDDNSAMVMLKLLKVRGDNVTSSNTIGPYTREQAESIWKLNMRRWSRYKLININC